MHKKNVSGLRQQSVCIREHSVSRHILYENAAGQYGFDLGLLVPDTERVGFEVDGGATSDRR
jgi:hypothetical protein